MKHRSSVKGQALDPDAFAYALAEAKAPSAGGLLR